MTDLLLLLCDSLHYPVKLWRFVKFLSHSAIVEFSHCRILEIVTEKHNVILHPMRIDINIFVWYAGRLFKFSSIDIVTYDTEALAIIPQASIRCNFRWCTDDWGGVAAHGCTGEYNLRGYSFSSYN